MRAGNRKQAMVPEGATVLEPVGTAPGLVVPARRRDGGRAARPARRAAADVARGARDRGAAGRAGRRRGLRAADHAPVRAARVRDRQDAARRRGRRRARSTAWRSRPACAAARSRSRPSSSPTPQADYAAFEAAVLERHGATVFARDGETIDELVAAALLGPPVRTVAVAESCTGGLMAGRLTDRAGSSAYVLGGLTVYSNEAKVALAGVDAALIERHGAVSPEVAVALADGAIERLGADVGIGITGIAGPGGGSEEKPVGTVCLSVAARDGAADRPHAPAPRQPRDGARAHDDRRDAPAAAAARWPSPTERLFVALDLPAAARAALAEFRGARRSARSGGPWPTRRCTSRSCSSATCPEGSSERAAEVVRACAGPAADLALGPALLLPPRRRARADRGGRGPCGRARSAAGAAVGGARRRRGLHEPERRAFRPHATVARLRAGERAPRELRIDGPEPVALRRRGRDALPLAAVARRRALRAARARRGRLIVQRPVRAAGRG